MKYLMKPVLAAAFIAGLFQYSSAQNDPDQTITVFKTPWCGCCKVWVEAMQKAGYTVRATYMEDLSAIKKQAGIPEKLEACHTSVIGDDRKYVLEGHVPIEAVEKLMTERPDVRGISTPGMPMGSLGMGYDPDAEYTVFSYTGVAGEAPAVFYEAGR